MEFSTIKRGIPNTTSYKVFIKDYLGPISALHDVPMHRDAFNFNAVILSPRWSNAKMEISNEPLNPIMHVQNNGQLEYVKNYFPYHGYLWNVGVFPQASEYNSYVAPEFKNVEILEIGSRIAAVGDVVAVKVLGAIELNEQHQRVIGIDTSDPLSTNLHTLTCVERYYPGFVRATTEWLKLQTCPTLPDNDFETKTVFDVQYVLRHLHKCWKRFTKVPSAAGNLSGIHVHAYEHDNKIGSDVAEAIVNATQPLGEPVDVASDINAWIYDHIMI